MKKTIAILSAFVALVACNKTVVPEQENPVPEDKQELKINFTVTRADINDTKATVKTGWAENDVVFVFFNGVAAPKYLEMKYNGTTWNTELKGMTADDLAYAAAAADRRMTAVYLPYGNAYTVGADGTAFTIKNGEENYSGHFYIDEQKTYTFVSSILSGKIELSAAQPASGSDKLVHFDVSQYTDGHTYAMYQENMKPISLSSIAADGEVATAEGTVGDALPGYIDADNSIVSISGVLESATGAKNWWFSIRDTEDGTLYYRDGGSKTVESNMYIGLGKLTAWNVATPGVFTVSAEGDKITIARSNLSYRGTLAENNWQLMKYPWSRIEKGVRLASLTSSSNIGLFGWATSGYNGKNPWMTSKTPTDYGPSGLTNGQEWTVNSEKWDWAKNNTVYEYGGEVAISGSWRTPAMSDWNYIIDSRDGMRYAKATVESIPGLILFPDSFTEPDGITIVSPNTQNSAYNSNSFTSVQWNKLEALGTVFLPAAGYRALYADTDTNLELYGLSAYSTDSYGLYTTSTIRSSTMEWHLRFNKDKVGVDEYYRDYGRSVRLVLDR